MEAFASELQDVLWWNLAEVMMGIDNDQNSLHQKVYIVHLSCCRNVMFYVNLMLTIELMVWTLWGLCEEMLLSLGI